MTVFASLAALLLLLGLSFVLPVFLRANGSQLAGGVASDSRASRWFAAGLALALPLLAVGIYSLVGNPGALKPPVAPESIQALTERSNRHGGDADNWRKLARAHEAEHRFGEAVQAYLHLVQLRPDDADILLDYAVTLAMASDQKLSGAPEQLIEKALVLAPQNPQALALSGSVRFERQDYKGAITRWRELLAQVPGDSPLHSSISDSIVKAESLLHAAAGRAAP